MTVLVVCPSRGRPDSVAALHECWTETKAGADLVVCVDDDDPARDRYPSWVTVGTPKRLGAWLNQIAVALADDYDIVALFGDDVRPRTEHWDLRVAEAMVPMGVVYGDDLIHGEANPSHAFLDAEIVRRLGYMVPPGQIHLYFDNFWKALGDGLGTLTYLPDVILEHLHPHVGTADWDVTYRASNSREMYRHDSAAFDRYVREQLTTDLEKLR